MRFPGFTDEWERVKLCDIADRITRKNKNLETERPLTISAQYGLIDQEDFFNKVVASNNLANYYMLKRGEFAYNKSYSSDYPWGAIKRLDLYDAGALSTLYICFNPKDKIDSDFLVHYFESPKWYLEVANIAGEGARNHGLLNISVVNFFQTQHYKPKQIEEQRKIAKLLDLISDRIATQNKIIEKLQSLIGGLYHALLSSVETDSLPLDKVALIRKGQQVNGENLTEGGEYYVMNGGTEPSGYYDQYNVCSDTISISEGGNSCGYVKYNEKPFWSGGHCYTLHDISHVNTRFLYHFLKYKEADIMKLRIGSGLPNIQKKDLGSFKIAIPSMQHQLDAVALFDAVESKLNVCLLQLNAFILQKQFLLHQLFI